MLVTKQLAKNVYQAYFGGNWTEVNLKDTLKTISLETASKKLDGFNTILALTYHIHYFTRVQLRVLEDGILDGKDSESYDHPKLISEHDWKLMQERMWNDVERYTKLIGGLSDSELNKAYINEKYGTYLSNILGLIEHTHYHLGQIIILNKLIEKRDNF